MSNPIEKYPIVVIAGAIGAGLLLRRFFWQRAVTNQRATEQAIYQDQNPWNMQTTAAMDAFQYYTVSTAQTRFVYGVGQEVNLVSTEMLDNALQQQHDQIIQEVQAMILGTQENIDSYINNAYNPYNVAIAGAANGNQMSLPANTDGVQG